MQKYFNSSLSWNMVRLKYCSSFIRGITFPKSSRSESFQRGFIPVATTKAAQENGIDHDKVYFIPKELVKRTEQLLKKDDIVISIANSLELVGRVTPVRSEDIGLTWGAFLGVLRANPKFLFPRFLYLHLKYIKTKEFFRRNARTTTNISNISSDTILSCPVPLPPLAEQKRIVKKIEELFAVIDKNIQKLEHTQQALIQYRQSVLNLYFKKSRAPKQKIKMLCQVVRGGSPRPAGDLRFYNGPIPFLKVADLTHSSGKFITTAEHSIKPAGLVKTRQVPANTLLLSNSGATLGIPKICSFSTTFNDGIAAFLNLPPETLDYHYYFWCSQTQELRSINQGAAQPNLNTTIIENTEIPVPSLPEQKAIVEKIEKAFACADKAQAAISAALEQAKQLKQSILKRAFEGRLVPQDPNDKPVDLTQITPKGKIK